MNREEREYTERRSLSELKPWHTEDKETIKEAIKESKEEEDND